MGTGVVGWGGVEAPQATPLRRVAVAGRNTDYRFAKGQPPGNRGQCPLATGCAAATTIAEHMRKRAVQPRGGFAARCRGQTPERRRLRSTTQKKASRLLRPAKKWILSPAGAVYIASVTALQSAPGNRRCRKKAYGRYGYTHL